MATLIKNGTVVNADGQSRSDVLFEGETIARVAHIFLRKPYRRRRYRPAGDARWGGCSHPGYALRWERFRPIITAPAPSPLLSGEQQPSSISSCSPVATPWLRRAKPGWPRATVRRVSTSAAMAVTDLGPGDGAQGLAEMERMVEKGISSFKLFMAYPNVLMIDDGLMFKVMHKAGMLNALCCVHAENGHVIDIVVARMIAKARPRALPCAQPFFACRG